MTLIRDNHGHRSCPAWHRHRPRRSAVSPVSVAVIGGATAAPSLALHLPEQWSVRRGDEVAAETAQLVVVYEATGDSVKAARAAHPDSTVLGVVSNTASVDALVQVLEAGADACVRDRGVRVIASHVRACERRRQHVELIRSGRHR